MSRITKKFFDQNAGADQQLLTQQRGLLTRLVLLSAAVLLTGQITISWFALGGFEQELEPQLNQKANAVGFAISAQIAYAVDDLKIPAEELFGMDTFLDNILIANEDIEYLSLLDSAGEILFSRGILEESIRRILHELDRAGDSTENFAVEIDGYVDGAFPVQVNKQGTTVLHVGVSSEHVRTQLAEILYEIITVIAIFWLVTLEFLVFFMGSRVSEPMEHIRRALAQGSSGIFANQMVMRTRDEIGQLVASFNRMLQNLQNRYSDFQFEVRELREAQIDESIAHQITEVHKGVTKRFRFTDGIKLRPRNAMQIRVPLFMFVFAEEMSRSFLPLFVSRYAPLDSALPHEVLVGLPITLFMLAAMLVTPLGGGFVDRFGTRRVFLAGIVAATLGFVGNFLTQTYIDLVLWRVLTGVGYGLVFIASEGWVTRHAERHTRAKSTSVFVGAVFVGIICGPPLGGILADRIGFEATFLFSAALAIVSGLMVYQVFRHSESVDVQRSKSRFILSIRDWFVLLRDVRFLSVLLFSAVPGKMMVAGFIAYLVPLYLNELGHNQSSIGRIMMLYGIATISCIAIAARFADRSGKYSVVIALGTAVAGIGCIFSFISDSIGADNAVIIAILALGFGHALTLTSQNSMIQQVAERYRDTMGIASVISAYRLIERLGMVSGPLLAVALIAFFGYQGAIAAFGCILIVLITIFVLLVIVPGSTDKSRRAEVISG